MKGISLTAQKEDRGMDGDIGEISALDHESSPQRGADASGFWTRNPPWEELQTFLEDIQISLPKLCSFP